MVAAAVLLPGCHGSNGHDNGSDTITAEWNFDNADGWNYYHQDTATVTQWAILDGQLALTTRAYTHDRTKMHTDDSDYADGTYYWRTYVPAIGPGEQVSIGSWIYHDDHHELDFEVGPGKAEIRAQHDVAPDELLACMTSQDFPFISGYTPIKPGWHDFSIKLETGADGKYTAIWSIDSQEKQRQKLDYGPEIGFAIQCSVENLMFIGDTISTSDYTALYDRVSFTGHKATAPEPVGQ